MYQKYSINRRDDIKLWARRGRFSKTDEKRKQITLSPSLTNKTGEDERERIEQFSDIMEPRLHRHDLFTGER